MVAFHIVTDDKYFLEGVACILDEYRKDCKIYHTTGDSFLFLLAFKGIIILDKRIFSRDEVSTFHKAIMESTKPKIIVCAGKEKDECKETDNYANCTFTNNSVNEVQKSIKKIYRKLKMQEYSSELKTLMKR